MKLTFYGGAQSVTGSNYLLEVGDVKVLIDCGIFQGSIDAEEKNYSDFPYKPADLSAVFLSHSHADHTGRLPKLYKDGFRGILYATHPTLDMTFISLPDNLSLLTGEATRHNHPPLFSDEDLQGIKGLAQGVNYGQEINLGPDFSAVLHDAGHILGSSIIEFRIGGNPDDEVSGLRQSSQGVVGYPLREPERRRKIYFSGDLGNPPTPLLRPFEYPLDADYIVIESAYGNRIHEDRSTRKEKLRAIVKETILKGGTLMIPSFAMERTQELLFELNAMHNVGEIPAVPMFLDSPLAIKLTEVYQKYPEYFNKESKYIIDSGDDLFNFPGLTYCRTSEESKNINKVIGPKVIIAGSGMSAGGRILHHERRYLSDPNSTLLFIGFQAEGTLGRKIFDGEKEVNIFDEKISVNCRVEAIGGYSAHADQPTLLSWIAKGAESGNLKKVFAVQGETTSATTLTELITTQFHVPAVVPAPNETVEL